MTEEELLKNIKTNKNELLDINSKIYDDLDIELLINLIEKQQKEIEEASLIMERQLEDICDLKDYISDCISKDKIRKMIKEIGTYTFDSEEEIKKFDYCIYLLKELLEE